MWKVTIVFIVLLAFELGVDASIIYDRSICNNADVRTVRSSILHPVYFCNFYLAA